MSHRQLELLSGEGWEIGLMDQERTARRAQVRFYAGFSLHAEPIIVIVESNISYGSTAAEAKRGLVGKLEAVRAEAERVAAKITEALAALEEGQ